MTPEASFVDRDWMLVSWRLQHHGWAVCAVGDDLAEAEALVSYVTDGPEEFLTAVAHLVLGWSDTRVQFEAEPAAYRLIFHRDHDDVDIRLMRVRTRDLPDGPAQLCGPAASRWAFWLVP